MPNPAGLGEAELPDWAPLGWNVADYLPHRTLSQSLVTTTQGEDIYRLCFDDTTRPTGDAVSRLLADGVAWVSTQVSPLNVVSQGAAAVVATLYAAAAVERGWPADDSSLQRANDLEKRMDILLQGLITSNAKANGQDDSEDGFAVEVAPLWSFPPANPRYDSPTYW